MYYSTLQVWLHCQTLLTFFSRFFKKHLSPSTPQPAYLLVRTQYEQRGYKFSKGYLPFFFLGAFMLAPDVNYAQTPTENCTNGIDDDGDGLIDCYDPDCNCQGPCASFYYTDCADDCFYVPPCDQINLGIDWKATVETGTYSTLVAGDMDADGMPDVVCYEAEGKNIYIVDGGTGATKITIISPSTLRGGTAPAIADLDKDGFGEIVIVAQDRRLRCYDHDGTLKWTSDPVGYDYKYEFSIPSIADFDNNGTAEVLIGNQVYNGQTGALIGGAGSNFSAGEHPARKALGFSFNSSVAMDVLPDNFCADCAGLEIVAGNQVFSVNETTGKVLLQTQAPIGYMDGFTAVVDFDRDGDLDAVVQGRKNNWNTIYTWDLQTSTVLREFKLLNNFSNGASRPNVADLNGDGKLEVSFVGFPWFYALNNDFQIMWKNPNDDASSITCSSVFDFCGDGSADIVYRGQTYLSILEGATGVVKFQDNCSSATHIENPLILDVDADNQTEIVILCGAGPDGNGPGTVVAYEATNTAAIASRRVWNQHAYFSTNINDDLSVPMVQQSPHLVGDGLKLNGFLNQYFNPTFPSPDVSVNLGSVVCKGDSIQVEITLQNNGAATFPQAAPISFYKGNPTNSAAIWVGALPLPMSIARNATATATFTIPRVANDSIFIVINDDHSIPTPFNFSTDFPSTTIGECDFGNNMTVFYYAYKPDVLDIGADTMICHSGQMNLNASGNDYVSWAWENGATTPSRTALSIGTYLVTVSDVCGISQTATRTIRFDSSTIVQLGLNREICQGDGLQLAAPGFDSYTWTPTAAVDCADCFSVTAFPLQTTNIVLEAHLTNGCFSRDTVHFEVHPVYDLVKDTTVCYGLDVVWDGISVQTDKQHVFTYNTAFGCDSIVTLKVHGTSLGTYQIQADTAVCKGNSLIINGLNMQAGQAEVFNLYAQTGCDSTVAVFVAPKDTFATDEQRTICFGENSMIFGQTQTSGGIFKQKFTAQNGCDSSHTVELFILPEITLEVDGTATCLNETSGAMDLKVFGGSPPYAYTWNPSVSSSAKAKNLAAGTYDFTVSDTEGCSKAQSETVDAFPTVPYQVIVDSIRCFGENNGRIRVNTPDASSLVAFDGGTFSQQYDFGALAPGSYPVWVQDEYGCVDSLDVSVQEPPKLVVELIGEHSVNLGDSVDLEIQTTAITPSTLTYTWSPNLYLTCDSCMETYSKPIHSVQYQLQVEDPNGCKAQTSFMLAVERIIDVYVPNVFTPTANIDLNTRLQPHFGAAIQEVRAFRVFDRWGTKVHEVTDRQPQDLDMAWDGTVNGKFPTGNTFVWQLELLMADGLIETVFGDVTVLR